MSNFKTINGIKVADGDLRNNVAREFDPSIAYSPNEFVFHDNRLYMCRYPTIAGEAWNIRNWGQTTLGYTISTIIANKKHNDTITMTQGQSYTPQSDCYVEVVSCTASNPGTVRAQITDGDGNELFEMCTRESPSSASAYSCFVKKGMRIKADTIEGNGHIYVRLLGN